MFYNDYDIENAVRRHASHLVLGRATRFLRQFADEANSHSDGWHSWPAPCRAAQQLIELIHRGHATDGDLKRALAPIKSFYTRRGNAAGMRWPNEI
jgi:hypothetical protein